MYIAIEGIDGVGKSTQLALLQEHLPNCIVTKEPGGTPFGLKLRKMLLNNNNFSKETEILLFLADRAEHRDKVLLPHLKEGKTIISDRSFISGIAYANNSFSDDQLIDLNRFALANLFPHKVIFLTLDETKIEARFEHRDEAKDHIEQRGLRYLISVQNKMHEVLNHTNIPYIKIDATLSIETIAKQIKEFLDD
jgi:dTMP kinase